MRRRRRHRWTAPHGPNIWASRKRPRGAEGRLFFCGDLGLRDADGRIHVLGRKERRHRPRGRYIRPLEIEDVVMTIPGVSEAGAAGTPEGRWRQRSSWRFRRRNRVRGRAARGATERLPASLQPD